MLDMPYIEAFLSKVEGPRQTRGYIPCFLGSGTANYRGEGDPSRYRAMGASGVTIATGCDLGQTTRKTLLSWGLPDAVASLYSFYFGKRKDQAIAALHSRPLTITAEAAAATDLAVHTGYLNRLVRPAFERASSLKFNDLPSQAQAVVMSVCFQKGCGGVARDWPILWGALTSGNWQLASRELMTGFRDYRTRRLEEGKLLAGLA